MVGRNPGIGRTGGWIWLLCFLILLWVIAVSPMLMSAALVNRGAVQCGNQLIVHRALDLALIGQPLGLDVAAGCAGALSDLEAAQRLNLNSARSEFWIGYTHLARGDLASAAAAFDRSADLEPRNSVTWLFAGIAYYSAGQKEMALSRWRRIHDSTRAVTRLADRLAQQEECPKAEAYYRLAIQQARPGLDEAHLGLADCLYKQERFEEAAIEYQTALDLGLKNAVAANKLGKVLVARGQVWDAIPYLQHAIEWHWYPWYMVDLANAYGALGDHTNAEFWFGEAERAAPNNAVGPYSRGDYYMERHMYAKAIESYERAINVMPDCPAYCYGHLGQAYLAGGYADKAVKAITEALRREPTSAFYQQSLEAARAAERNSPR